MGGSQSSNTIVNRWEFITRVEGLYSLVRDKNGREGEEYIIPIRSDTIAQEQFAIYNLRKTSPHQIVGVYGSQFENQPGLCTSNASFRVITQHLYLRFCDPFKLNIQEAFYILIEVIIGLNFLYSKVGFFELTSKMIGLTAEGQLRVWMNQKFGQNRPQNPKYSIKAVALNENKGINQEQSNMIKQIFQIVENHSQKQSFQVIISQCKDKSLNFISIQGILHELKARFRISDVQRIDLMKKSSNLMF